eukprot:TRINITY_DN175_c0_g3_i1.p1 TRINITY_DN175_c0_g3~~TRINITY_DN175_c0_g3_i1.p1  ORF type:complete len:872 (-),score=214.61 TRINITY_DN175_c0_g3_i1:462-3077(-)
MSRVDIDDIVDRCRAQGKLYSDPDFRPGPSALFRPKSDNAGKPPKTGITGWKRPRDIVRTGTVQLYVAGASGGDVIQGALGDCWFLGALSVVATRPDLLEKLIPRYDVDAGVYECCFFKDGEWKYVTVDDLLPVIGNKIAYGACRDANEIWVPIVEKAYAKLHGNYQILEGGSVAQGLVDLTGGASEKITLADDIVQRAIKSGALWKRLKRYDASGFLMGCAFQAAGGPAEADTGMGILQNHAYGIMDVVEAGPDRAKLLRIRNPWGATEWKGRWSDGSRQWTKKIKQELDYEFGDDGTFWICFEDFCKYFSKIYICRLYEDDIGEKWKKFLVRDAMDETTAGGCMDHATWRQNPQFAFTLTKPRSRFFVVLAQDDCRMRGATTTDIAVGFYVFRSRAREQKHKLINEQKLEIVNKTTFSFTREVSLELNLDNDGTYIIMPCSYEAGQHFNYTLTVYGEHDFPLRELGEPPSAALSGEWKYANAGGCPNHPSWNRNDQFLLQPYRPTLFTIVLSQPKVRKPKELNQFGFQVARTEKGGAIPQLTNDNLLAQSDYTNAEAVTCEVKVRGDAPVTIIPSTFMPTKLGKYTVRVFGSSPFLFGRAPPIGTPWEGEQLMRVAQETGEFENGPTLSWTLGDEAPEPVAVATPQRDVPSHRQAPANVPPLPRVPRTADKRVQAPGSSSRMGSERASARVSRQGSRAGSRASQASQRSVASSRQQGNDSGRSQDRTAAAAAGGRGSRAGAGQGKVVRHGRRASQSSQISSAPSDDSRTQEEIRRLEQLALTSERPRPRGVIQKGPQEAVNVMSYGLWSRINPGYSKTQFASTTREDFEYDPQEAQAVKIVRHNRVKNDHTEFVEARARQNNLIKQGGR